MVHSACAAGNQRMETDVPIVMCPELAAREASWSVLMEPDRRGEAAIELLERDEDCHGSQIRRLVNCRVTWHASGASQSSPFKGAGEAPSVL